MLKRRRQYRSDHHSAVSQRFEAKYLIRDSDALAIREYIRPYTEPDAHGQEYPVTSVYLDSADLNMYWSSNLGEELRQKLRVRTYAGGNGETCYFEIKRRINQIVKKERAIVYSEFASALIHGATIRPEMLVDPVRDLRHLYAFCDIRETLQATPRVVVRYMREAHVGKMEEPLRITFDQRITCLPSSGFDPPGWAASPYWLELPGSTLVLEIKFTDTFPHWVGEIIHGLNLMRISFAKYVVCVDALKRAGVGVGGHTEDFA